MRSKDNKNDKNRKTNNYFSFQFLPWKLPRSRNAQWKIKHGGWCVEMLGEREEQRPIFQSSPLTFKRQDEFAFHMIIYMLLCSCSGSP